MKPSLRVIHVEDCHSDSELVRHMLKADGFDCEVKRVETRGELIDALEQSECDLILSDCSMPQFHGLEALHVAHALKPEIPFIFISGTIGEETAIKSLQNGATDYVLKQRLSRLIPAVRRALTEAEGRAARNTMETQLRQARKLEMIGTLAGGLAHDFRNVLQIQKMSTALLPLKAHDPEQVIQIAAQLEKSIERGYNMIQELLVFARKTDANLVPVAMAERITELAEMLRVALPATINLSLHLEKNLPPVSADPGQLERMLTNLILNARDAMPQGGEISVSTDVIKFDHVSSNSWQIKDDPYLRIRISDNGTGMDETTLARIFEPFFTTKPAGKGTGLGLSVVYGLMEAHQGFIDLHSKVGEGTTFSLFFPLSSKTKVLPDRIQVISPSRLLGSTAPSDSHSAPQLNAVAAVK